MAFAGTKVVFVKKGVGQDFANVCCQMFLTSLTNADRLNFVLFGDGIVTMDFLEQSCTHNKIAVSPLFYCVSFRDWLEHECERHGANIDVIEKAKLRVEMEVETYRNSRGGIPGWLSTRMKFACASEVAINGITVNANMTETQERGLGQVLTSHHY